MSGEEGVLARNGLSPDAIVCRGNNPRNAMSAVSRFLEMFEIFGGVFPLSCFYFDV